MRRDASEIVIKAAEIALYVFLLAPLLMVVATSFGEEAVQTFPPKGFSLLWEQGTRWIDARRFNRLGDIPPDIPPSFPAGAGHVPPVMPVPKGECDARSLTASEVITGVVTCQPPLM